MNALEFIAIRKNYSLTQKELAEKFEVSGRTITRIENSVSDVPKIYQLAILGIAHQNLFT